MSALASFLGLIIIVARAEFSAVLRGARTAEETEKGRFTWRFGSYAYATEEIYI